MNKHILIVDDEINMVKTLNAFLSQEGYAVSSALNAKSALQVLQEQSFDLVLADLRMPDMSGLDLIKTAKTLKESPAIMIMTAYASIESAVECMKEGALDFFVKPFDMDEIKIKLARFFEQTKLRDDIKFLQIETFSLKESLKDAYDYDNIVGNDPKINEIKKLIMELAGLPSSIFIHGETGTGKELVARAVHYMGTRSSKPFIKVDCSSLSPTLLESELFGHEKGAFTGAVASKRGRFELADGGTLFLDEIGDIPKETQVKLLRVLEDRQFERVGGEKTYHVDVRIISASNRDLKEQIRKGIFREDLYFRLNVIPVGLPPLRERLTDIPLLVRFFIEKYSRELKKKIQRVDKDALQIMTQYDWPGNVRELRNIIERMVVLEKADTITTQSLPEEIRKDMSSQQESLTLTEIGERNVIQSILVTTDSLKEAARKLNMDRTTLWRKIKKYKIDVSRMKQD